MDLRIKGKNAIVTGGSKGIGAGICEVLAEEGVNLVVDYRSDPEGSEEFVAKLNGMGIKAVGVQADVSIEEGVDKVYECALEHFDRIDILVNNAGRGIHVPFNELTVQQWRNTQDVCLNSQFLMSHKLVKLCLEWGTGAHIVNVLSKAAFTTNSTGNTAYISAKGGGASFTRGLANEVTQFGIIVNGIVPGYVHNSRGAFNPETSAYAKKLIEEFIPTKRFGTPREMGDVVAFICSPRASQIIGSIIDCSGGTML